jgi:hypothetical protein
MHRYSDVIRRDARSARRSGRLAFGRFRPVGLAVQVQDRPGWWCA